MNDVLETVEETAVSEVAQESTGLSTGAALAIGVAIGGTVVVTGMYLKYRRDKAVSEKIENESENSDE